jgi:hypothetical protein
VTGQLSGDVGGNCGADHAIGGIGFLIQKSASAGVFQTEFVDGSADNSVCIRPLK